MHLSKRRGLAGASRTKPTNLKIFPTYSSMMMDIKPSPGHIMILPPRVAFFGHFFELDRRI
jgi:hypothetical protein